MALNRSCSFHFHTNESEWTDLNLEKQMGNVTLNGRVLVTVDGLGDDEHETNIQCSFVQCCLCPICKKKQEQPFINLSLEIHIYIRDCSGAEPETLVCRGVGKE